MANWKRKRTGNEKRKSMGSQKRRMIMIMIMNINGKLPEHIVEVIFSKLAFCDLPNCRIVCKAWNRVVLDYSAKFHIIPKAFLVYSSDSIIIQHLPYDHLQHLNPKMSCIDFDFDRTTSLAAHNFDPHCHSVQIYASCNGLLYILKQMSVYLWCKGVWNPMTNEFFKIPGSELEEDMYRIGFGFNPKTKHYKLFRITYEEEDDEYVSTIEVWRFGISHQWEHLECRSFMIPHHGIYLGGVIYWFGYDATNQSVIYALDVETETFETIAILDLGPNHSAAKFQPFNDTICLVVFYPLKVEVWIMRAKHSWIKEFVIDLPRVGLHKFYHVKAFEDQGDIYFLVGNDLFGFGKNGKKTKLKTLFNPREKVIEGVVHLQAFHFGSLQKILAGSH